MNNHLNVKQKPDKTLLPLGHGPSNFGAPATDPVVPKPVRIRSLSFLKLSEH